MKTIQGYKYKATEGYGYRFFDEGNLLCQISGISGEPWLTWIKGPGVGTPGDGADFDGQDDFSDEKWESPAGSRTDRLIVDPAFHDRIAEIQYKGYGFGGEQRFCISIYWGDDVGSIIDVIGGDDGKSYEFYRNNEHVARVLGTRDVKVTNPAIDRDGQPDFIGNLFSKDLYREEIKMILAFPILKITFDKKAELRK